MSIPTQIVFPPVSKHGIWYQYRINRVTEAGEAEEKKYQQTDLSNTLYLAQSSYIQKLGSIHKEKSIGFSFADEISYSLIDRFAYSGVLGDGTPVSEDLYGTTTMLESFFNDYEEGTYYRTFISQLSGRGISTAVGTAVTSFSGDPFDPSMVGLSIELEGLGVFRIEAYVSPTEVTVDRAADSSGLAYTVCELGFIGTSNPNEDISEEHQLVLDEHTDTEVRLPLWTIRSNSLKSILELKTVGDMRDSFEASDMVDGGVAHAFYGGLSFTWKGNPESINPDTPEVSIVPMGDGTLPDLPQDTVVSVAGRQKWHVNKFPVGGYAVTHSTVFTKLFDTIGVEFSGADDSCKFLGQVWQTPSGYLPNETSGSFEWLDLASMHFNMKFGFSSSSEGSLKAVDTGTNTLTIYRPAGTPRNGDKIYFVGPAETGDEPPLTPYYVINATPFDSGEYTFQISATLDGTPASVSGLTTSYAWGFVYTSYPCTWDKDMTLAELLKLMCNQWLVDAKITYNQLTKEPIAYLRSIRKPEATDVTEFLEGKLVARSSKGLKKDRKYRHVKLTNSNTEGYAACPDERGDAIEIEIPFQVRPWGDKNGIKVKHLVYDKKRGYTDQYALWAGSGGESSNFGSADNFIAGLYIYSFYSSGAGQAQYPPIITDGWLNYDAADFEGLYAQSFWAWKGAGDGPDIAGDESIDPATYGNTLYDAAQIFANELLTGHKVERTYSTVVGPNGRLSELDTGVTCEFKYRGSVRKFKSIAVDPDFDSGTTRFVWVEYKASGVDQTDRTFKPLPVIFKDGDGQRTGGSGSTGGSGFGGATGGSSGGPFVANKPATTERNYTEAQAAGVVPLTTIGYEADTANLLSLKRNASGTPAEVASVTYNGVIKGQNFACNVTPVSATYQILNTDGVVVASANTFTATMPASPYEGQEVNVTNQGAGTITVARSGTQTINGVTTSRTLAAGYGEVYKYDGTSNWVILSSYTGPAVGGSPYFDDPGTTPSTAPSATGTHSVAIGDGADARTGARSIAIGNSRATGADSIAIQIGSNTSTYGAQNSNAVAIGFQAKSTGTRATAIGNTNTASGVDSAVIGGASNTASQTRSATIGGELNLASGFNSVVIGGNNNGAAGNDSVVIGGSTNEADTTSTATASVVIGYGNVSGSHSVAIQSNGSALTADYAVNLLAKETTNSWTRSVCMGPNGTDAVANTVFSSALTTWTNAGPAIICGAGSGNSTGLRCNSFVFTYDSKLYLGGKGKSTEAAGTTGSIIFGVSGSTTGYTLTAGGTASLTASLGLNSPFSIDTTTSGTLLLVSKNNSLQFFVSDTAAGFSKKVSSDFTLTSDGPTTLTTRSFVVNVNPSSGDNVIISNDVAVDALTVQSKTSANVGTRTLRINNTSGTEQSYFNRFGAFTTKATISVPLATDSWGLNIVMAAAATLDPLIIQDSTVANVFRVNPQGTIVAEGGIRRSTRTVNTAGTTTLTENDYFVECDPVAAAGAITIALPQSNTVDGMVIHVKRVTAGANVLTIDPFGAETIDGAATVALPGQWDNYTLIASGNNWRVLSII